MVLPVAGESAGITAYIHSPSAPEPNGKVRANPLYSQGDNHAGVPFVQGKHVKQVDETIRFFLAVPCWFVICHSQKVFSHLATLCITSGGNTMPSRSGMDGGAVRQAPVLLSTLEQLLRDIANRSESAVARVQAPAPRSIDTGPPSFPRPAAMPPEQSRLPPAATEMPDLTPSPLLQPPQQPPTSPFHRSDNPDTFTPTPLFQIPPTSTFYNSPASHQYPHASHSMD